MAPASTTEALGRPALRCHVVLQVLARAPVVDLPVHWGGAFHHQHLIGHDGPDLGRYLVVVQLVPDRLVHELLYSLGHDRDDPDLHPVAESLAELHGQSLGLFLPLRQLQLDIPQLFELQGISFHILAQHVVDLRRMAVDIFRGKLLGQLLITDLQPSSRPSSPSRTRMTSPRSPCPLRGRTGFSRFGCQ